MISGRDVAQNSTLEFVRLSTYLQDTGTLNFVLDNIVDDFKSSTINWLELSTILTVYIMLCYKLMLRYIPLYSLGDLKLFNFESELSWVNDYKKRA